jgi:hypothetical protein
MKTPMLRVAIVAATACFCMFAQVERASIIGTIIDKTGAVVPGATVHVTSEATNAIMVLATGDSGNYSAPNLVPGSYTVTAMKPGFSRAVIKGFVVQVGQAARLDITLDVGSVEAMVEVQAAAPLLQTEDSAVGQVIAPEPIAALPLNGRNFVQLAILAPGVSGLDYAQPATINSGRRPDELRPGGTALQANGVRSYLNQVLIDGIDATEMISQTFVVRPAVEGVQEFRVLTNNAGAEYGRGAGAVINITTKSGGNQFHGAVFEYLRNSALDAKNFFDRPDQKIPPFRLNQFGGALGGRIRRDKTFFFTDYEGYHEVVGQTRLVTVPTEAMRRGDFRGAVPNGIFDPLMTNTSVNPATRERFAGDQIPMSRFDPIAAKLVNLYPLPQRPGLANNYTVSPQKRSATDRADARIDHVFSAKNNFFFRYSIDESHLTIPDTFNTDIGGNEDSFAGPNDVRGQSLVAADTHIFQPNVIGDFRFGYTRFSSFLVPTTLTNPVWKEIPGRDTKDPYQPSAPIISPAGYAGLGNSRSDPLIRQENMQEYIGSLSWLRNAHNLKFGADIRRRLISETASPPGESAFGRFNFDNALTNNPASAGGTGHVIATMLLGYPARTTRDFFLPGQAFVNSSEFNFYARDEWRVRRNLTLNLGVHYEINTPFTERNNYWANFDPARGELLLAGKDGVSRTANIRTDYRSVGPRFGFAWQASGSTVLRGGYGIFFAPEGRHDTTIRQFRQVPFDLIFSIIPGALVPGNKVSEGFKGVNDFPPPDPKKPFGNLRGVAQNYRNAAVQQFNLGVQREVGRNSVVGVTFVGSLGRHLTWNQPLNQPDPGPGAINPRRPFYSKFPDVVNIQWVETVGNSAYTSLQTSFEKRFGRGLYFLGNWTWAHGLDNSGGDGGANGPIPQNPRNRRADWGSQNSDIRHRVNLAWNYALPFAQNLNGPVRHALHGWEIAGVSVMQSGLPFTVTATGSPTNTGAGTRADVVPGVNPKLEERSPSLWFNPAAFRTPTAFNWGNVGRNTLTGPPIYNFDFTLSKRFVIREAVNLTFRSEFFNAFNTPQFTLPASSIGATGVGTISSTARANRQIQFALRLAF